MTRITGYFNEGFKSILTVLFLLLMVSTYGQVDKKKNYFPIWTYHQKNINIHGVSIGIGTVRSEPRYTNTNGVKVEIIGAGLAVLLIPYSPVAQNDSEFIQLSKEPISEVINGLSISALGTVCDCIANGINVGLVGSINYQVNGITASFFGNFAQKQNGVQLALINDSYYMNGVQLGLANFNVKSNGIQIGAINLGEDISGLQIGLFNKSKKLKGIQFGLWNINQKRKFPLINWNFSDDIK